MRRYTNIHDMKELSGRGDDDGMRENPNGDWVRWVDVAEVVTTADRIIKEFKSIVDGAKEEDVCDEPIYDRWVSPDGCNVEIERGCLSHFAKDDKRSKE